MVSKPDTACTPHTHRCTPPPMPAAEITRLVMENPSDLSEVNTALRYRCPLHRHYFGYPVGPDFVSFHYTDNVDDIEIRCNQDGLWEVQGGIENVTWEGRHKGQNHGCQLTG